LAIGRDGELGLAKNFAVAKFLGGRGRWGRRWRRRRQSWRGQRRWRIRWRCEIGEIK